MASSPDSTSVHVIAIGLAVDGADAAIPLLEHLPQAADVAFLIVPEGEGEARAAAVARIRNTVSLPVVEVDGEVPLEPGRIYLPAPGREIRAARGQVRALSPGQRSASAFDSLLLALAAEAGERSVAVIMASVAPRAYRGLRAVKEAGGLVVLERAAGAAPEDDPDRPLGTGIADYVLPPAEMPEKILAFTRRAARSLPAGDPAVPGADLDRITGIVSERTGVDFSDYKSSTVLRRIERRMAVNALDSIGEYADLLARSPGEAATLYRELLIGVTRFFRDPEAFAELREHVLKPLLQRGKSDEPLRIWVAGCSTGEEAYTIAILLQEAMHELDRRRAVKIFATDLDREAVQFASAGSYPASIAADVPQELLARWFVRKGERYQVAKAVRELVVFAPHNLQKDPPFYRIDLITCRNLMIYLQAPLQRRIFATFHFALNHGGHLMLGSSETLGEMAQYFAPVDAKYRIYQKQGDKKAPVYTEGLFSAHRQAAPALTLGAGKKESPPSSGDQLDQAINNALLREFLPAFLVVSETFEIVHVFGDIGRFLTLPVGKPTFNLLKMAPRELAVALGTAIRRALKEGKPVVYDGVVVAGEHGGQQRMRLLVRPFPFERSLGNHVVVVFEEEGSPTTRAAPAQPFDLATQSEQRIHDLELEVQQTSESLQAAIEELETANEELQATNEEVLASNEELQSTNEELQSVNEELYTVNAEHQVKITELTELNNDILNFLSSTNIGTVFLDQRLCVRKFTPAATAQINLMDRDIGRPLEHLSSNLKYANLVSDAAEVLRTLVPLQREVMTRDGAWYLMRVLPYRTEDNVIKGVVLTFIDISQVKSASESFRKLSLVVENSASIVMICDAGGKIEYVNRAFVATTGWSAEEVLGRDTEFLSAPGTDRDQLARMWATVAAGAKWQGRSVNRAKDGREFVEDAIMVPMQDAGGTVVSFLRIGEIVPG